MNGMSESSKEIATEKRELLAKLRRRLADVAGTKTPWEEIEVELGKMNLTILRALEYRVDRALANEYESGSCRVI